MTPEVSHLFRYIPLWGDVRYKNTDYFFSNIVKIMQIPCSQCSQRYDIPVHEEYLIKMGLIPFDSPLFCEDCKHTLNS